MAVSTIEEAIADIKAGKMVILVDDEDRENEGDLCMAAEFITPEAVNFMAKFGRGLICLTLSSDIVDQLKLPMMVAQNKSPYGTGFTISIEAREGVSSGYLGGRQGAYHRGGSGGRCTTEGYHKPWSYLSSAGPGRWRSGADRTDRRVC